jgi:hypothetical protein
MKHDQKAKPMSKCDRCGVFVKRRSKHCIPCSDIVREENYRKART